MEREKPPNEPKEKQLSVSNDNDCSPKSKRSNGEQCQDRNLKNTKKRNVELVPPDGGYGWMVVLGSFLALTLCSFPMFGFGIIFSPLLISFNASSTKIAWIFNVHRLVYNFSALLAGPLNEEFTWRKVAIFGGILNSLSVFLSAFAPSPEFLFFSYSLLGGIGSSFSHIVSLIAVSRYFVKNRGLAMGIMSLGTSISSFLSPIVANYLIENYGYVGASLIFGALVLNQCVGSALLQPVKWHMKPVEQKPVIEAELNEDFVEISESNNSKIQLRTRSIIQQNRRFSVSQRHCYTASTYSIYSAESLEHSVVDTSSVTSDKTPEEISIELRQNSVCRVFTKVMKSTYDNMKTLKFMRVIIISLGAGFLILGHINFQLWIPFMVTNAGYSLEIAAWCVSAASITNIIGRILVSIISDRKIFNVTYGHMFGMLFMGISIIAFSLAQDIKLFLICVCCWGLGCGIAGSSYANNMIHIMGVEMFPAVCGLSSLCRGIFSIIFGPLAGIIRDATSSYTYALSLLGASELIGFVLYLLLPLATKYDLKLLQQTYT